MLSHKQCSCWRRLCRAFCKHSESTHHKHPQGKWKESDVARCTEGKVEFAESSKYLKDVERSQKILRRLLGFVLVSAYIKAAKVWLGIFAKELTEVKKSH